MGCVTSFRILAHVLSPLSGVLVAKESLVPIWAYCYCGLIVAGTIFNLFDKDKIKTVYQFSGETLSGICGVSIFLIAYNIVHFKNSELLSTLCICYGFIWAYHAHRHYLNYDKFKSDIHKSAIEVHENMLKEIAEMKEAAIADGAEPKEVDEQFAEVEQDYDFGETEKEAYYLYIGVLVLLSALVIPYLYVYLISIGAIGN